MVNSDLRVEKANDLAAQFAGREAIDMVGQRPGDAFGCLNARAGSDGCGTGPLCDSCVIRVSALDSLVNGAHHAGVEAWLPRSVDGVTQQRCLLVSTSLMRFGRDRKVLVCAQDITGRKRTELALQSALAEKTILLKEIHHRVKTTLP